MSLAQTRPRIAVLDINGVLADVRKHRCPAPKNGGPVVPPDLVLANGQKVYFRPGWAQIYRVLRRTYPTLVIWTSRTRRNADPIIQAVLAESASAGLPPPDLILCGEDCPRMCPKEPWRPMKDVSVVLARLGLRPDTRGDLVIVDDHPLRYAPQRRESQLRVRAVRIPSFDAASPDPPDTLSRILRIII